jgi:3-oxoacyl-[acyl-carrier protein] reductase
MTVAEQIQTPKTASEQRQSPVALVTGGSRGIGRAICLALAQAGCDVAINYAGNSTAATEAAETCQAVARQQGHLANRFPTFQADVADPQECERLLAAVSDDLGAVDILVNNAGITRDNLIMRMSLEDFDAVLAVNLRAAFMLSKLASRSMLRRRGGRIINITSVVGLSGNIGQANYAASKAGLIGLSKSLAREFAGRGVTVNAVAPGFIDTAMTEALDQQTRDRLLTAIPLQRLGTPEDVAAVVAFLASDQSGYITGQVIAVDGGMST